MGEEVQCFRTGGHTLTFWQDVLSPIMSITGITIPSQLTLILLFVWGSVDHNVYPLTTCRGLFGAGVNHPSLQVMAERTLGLACLDNCEKGPPVGGLGHCLVKRTAQGLIGGRLTLAAWRP